MFCTQIELFRFKIDEINLLKKKPFRIFGTASCNIFTKISLTGS